jgi:hypothetical protein
MFSPSCHANPSEEKPKLLRAEGNKKHGKKKTCAFFFSKVVESVAFTLNPIIYSICSKHFPVT